MGRWAADAPYALPWLLLLLALDRFSLQCFGLLVETVRKRKTAQLRTCMPARAWSLSPLACGRDVPKGHHLVAPERRERARKQGLKNQRNITRAGQSWTTAPRFSGNDGSAQADLAWRERMSHEQGLSKAQQLKAKLEKAMVR